MNRKLKKLLELYNDDELEQLLLKNAKEDNNTSNSSEEKKEEKKEDYNHDHDSNDADLKAFIAKTIKELMSQKDQDQDQKVHDQKKEEKKEEKDQKEKDQKERQWIPSNSTNADLFKPKKFQCIT